MAVITWKNVGGGGGGSGAGAAANLFEIAKSNTDSAFANFNKVLANQQRTDQENWDTTKDNNTANFKDLLAGAKSVEELAALEASGQLDASQYGAQIDRNVVREGADQRKDYLRDAFIKQEEFANVERIAKDAPYLDKIKAQISGADFNNPEVLAQSQALIQEAVANGMSEKSAIELNDYLTSNQRGDKSDLQGDQRHNSTLATQALNRASTSQSMNQNNYRFNREVTANEEADTKKNLLKEVNLDARKRGAAFGAANRENYNLDSDSYTTELNSLLDAAGGIDNLTVQEIDGITKTFKDSINQTHGLNETQTAEFNSLVQPISDRVERQKLIETANYDNELKNNQYIIDPKIDPDLEANKAIESVNEANGKGWDAKERAKMLPVIRDALANGVWATVDGERMRMPVSPAAIKNLLTESYGETFTWWDHGGSMEKLLENYVNQPEYQQRLNDAIKLPYLHTQKMNQLDGEVMEARAEAGKLVRKPGYKSEVEAKRMPSAINAAKIDAERARVSKANDFLEKNKPKKDEDVNGNFLRVR